MPLIMMATEYIQASVMKSGIERLITRKKLHNTRRPWEQHVGLNDTKTDDYKH